MARGKVALAAAVSSGLTTWWYETVADVSFLLVCRPATVLASL